MLKDITCITGYATILGKRCEVTFDNGVVTISELTYPDLLGVLNRVETVTEPTKTSEDSSYRVPIIGTPVEVKVWRKVPSPNDPIVTFDDPPQVPPPTPVLTSEDKAWLDMPAPEVPEDGTPPPAEDDSVFLAMDTLKDVIKEVQRRGATDYNAVKKAIQDLADTGACPLLMRLGNNLEDRLYTTCIAQKVPGVLGK